MRRAWPNGNFCPVPSELEPENSGRRSRASCAFYLFIRQPHGSEVSPAARNSLDSAPIPTASKLLICGLFQKGRVLAQDGVPITSIQRDKDQLTKRMTRRLRELGFDVTLTPLANATP